MRDRKSGFEVTRRGVLLTGLGAMASLCLPRRASAKAARGSRASSVRSSTSSTIVTSDGAELYFKDWGKGQPVVFSHGWPLSSDAFEDQMFFLAGCGYRCIAHDRRGHGRSSQPWAGNDMDTYADDLAALVDHLDLDKAILVGHSTGGGEVARYIGRHGTKRVAKAVLISGIPPVRIKSADNPGGLPAEELDKIQAAVQADRSQFWKDLSLPFYGYNRPGAKISEAVRESFWQQGMMASFPASYAGIKSSTEADFTEDLKRIDVPTLFIHGGDDQLVPVGDSAALSAKIVRNAKLTVVAGAPHGLYATMKDRINDELLAFIRG